MSKKASPTSNGVYTNGNANGNANDNVIDNVSDNASDHTSSSSNVVFPFGVTMSDKWQASSNQFKFAAHYSHFGGHTLFQGLVSKYKKERDYAKVSRDKMREQLEEIKDLEEELDEAKVEIETLQSKAANLEAERTTLVEKGNMLDSTNEKLVSTTSMLKEARATIKEQSQMLELLTGVPVKPVTEETEILLDRIFTTASDLVKRFFMADLPKDTFCSNAWKDFVHELEGYVRLPPSNLAVAKYMRAAAVLRCLGRYAARDLFQSVYILEKGDGAREFLDRVPDDQHALVRKNLLTITPEERQAKVAEIHAKAVADKVIAAVAGILPKDKRDAFEADVRNWSTNTGDIWRKHMQPLDTPVEFCDDILHMGDSREWVVLSFKTQGADAATGGQVKAQVQVLQPADEPEACIWPLFTIGGRCAKQGVVVTTAQVTRAMDEKKKARRDSAVSFGGSPAAASVAGR